MRLLLICMLCAATAYSQYSPGPPRLQIPGAIPIGGPVRHVAYRQGRLQAIPAPLPQGPQRIRRPGGLARPSFKSVDISPRPNLQSLEDPAKPVTEDPEDDTDINTPTAFSPNLFSTPEPQNDFYDISTTSQPKPPIAFNPTQYPQTTPSGPKLDSIRPTQYRPLLAPTYPPIRNDAPSYAPNRNEAPSYTPNRNEAPSYQPTRNEAPSYSPNRNEAPVKQQQPQRLHPLSSRPSRPVFRPEPRPILDEDEPIREPVRQYNRPQEPARNREPAKTVPHNQPQKWTQAHPKDKKPVAQILRKYREEHEDGSITWGFENDDGSFKEEFIGVDCITKGKYGYVDPDGVKREYNYETGIACDRSKETQEDNGYVDYQENKAVLPNGITVDLSAMGKKKSKRPFRSSDGH